VVATTQRPTTSARPPRTTAAPSLCEAPANPYGYNFCGRGGRITNPAPDVCAYFDCIANFENGTGYMVECHDAMYSMSGGRQAPVPTTAASGGPSTAAEPHPAPGTAVRSSTFPGRAAP
jgi:hypothetical protein